MKFTKVEPEPEEKMSYRGPDWTICEELRKTWKLLDVAQDELRTRFTFWVEGLGDVQKILVKSKYRLRIAMTMAKKMDGALRENKEGRDEKSKA